MEAELPSDASETCRAIVQQFKDDASKVTWDNTLTAMENTAHNTQLGLLINKASKALYESDCIQEQATAIDQTPFPSGEGRGEASKFIKEGQLLILRDGKMYTLTGAEIR